MDRIVPSENTAEFIHMFETWLYSVASVKEEMMSMQRNKTSKFE
jgi:hypothetical protein